MFNVKCWRVSNFERSCVEFKLFHNEVMTSLAALSAKNVELKEILCESIYVLRRFTSGDKNLRSSELLCTPHDGVNHNTCIDEGKKCMKPFLGKPTRLVIMGLRKKNSLTYKHTLRKCV